MTTPNAPEQHDKRPRLLDVEQAAEMLELGTSTLYRLARLGEVPSVRIGKKKLRFVEDDLLAYLRGGAR